MENDIRKAMKTLTEEMKEHPSYADIWHINLVKSFVEEGCESQTANEGAANFLQIVFGINIKNNPIYPLIFKTEPNPPPRYPNGGKREKKEKE